MSALFGIGQTKAVFSLGCDRAKKGTYNIRVIMSIDQCLFPQMTQDAGEQAHFLMVISGLMSSPLFYRG